MPSRLEGKALPRLHGSEESRADIGFERMSKFPGFRWDAVVFCTLNGSLIDLHGFVLEFLGGI